MGHSEQHRADASHKAALATADRHPVERADAQAVAAVAPLRDAWPVRAAAALSEVADQPPLVALSATVAIAGLATRNARLARAGGRMLTAHALATLAKKIVKDNVDRSRPQKLVDAGEYRMEGGDSREGDLRSFPSGHTAGGVAVVRALAREYPGSAWPAGLAMTGIAAALVPKQAHYPSDVAAGAAIGWLAEAIVDYGWERLERHLPNRLATR